MSTQPKLIAGLLLMWGLYASLPVYGQDIRAYKKSEPAKAAPKKSTTPKSTGKSGTASKKTGPGSKVYEVLFTANADSRLKINGRSKEELYEGIERKFNFLPGMYVVEAVSITTGDLYRDTLEVKALASQKYHIPMKEKIKEREGEWGKAAAVHEAAEGQVAGSVAEALAREISAQMVLVEGSSFTMGSNNGPGDAKPEHTVQLRPFYFGKYEITQQQWQQLMGSNPSSNKCVDCPVENVSPEDIILFLNKLNAASQRKFRLPTEAEWEYVALKGGGVQNLKSAAWYSDNARRKTQPVGKLSPNALGIYDLFGNVAEWCSDWYDAAYYRTAAAANPAGPGNGREKVVRGGSFVDGKKAFHAALRQKHSWYGKNKAIGFRLAAD